MAYRLGNRILKIDNKLFYAEGVAPINPVWNGLQSYWGLNEGSGTSTVDSKDSDNGTLSNVAMWNASGKNGYCVSTASKYIDFGSTYVWAATQAYSISFWTKNISTSNSVGLLIANTNSAGSGWIGLYYTPTNGNIYNNMQYINSSNRCGTGVASAIPMDTTSWTHVVFTYNGSLKASGCTWYINSIAKTQLASTDTLTYTGTLGANLQVGRNYTTTYQGSYVDEIGLWNRVLTQDEVTTLYNSGAGLFY